MLINKPTTKNCLFLGTISTRKRKKVSQKQMPLPFLAFQLTPTEQKPIPQLKSGTQVFKY